MIIWLAAWIIVIWAALWVLALLLPVILLILRDVADWFKGSPAKPNPKQPRYTDNRHLHIDLDRVNKMLARERLEREEKERPQVSSPTRAADQARDVKSVYLETVRMKQQQLIKVQAATRNYRAH